MVRASVVSLFLLILALITSQARAWGPDGHHTVGALADRLIAGTHAAQQVNTLLQGLKLRDVAVWADCAKGVSPKHGFSYEGAGRFPECKIFETQQGEAEMADFVRHNDTNCELKTTEDSCHKEYHYTDIAVQRSAYASDLTGARPDDIVGAVRAAIAVLKGDPSPAPFVFKNQREALLVLAHYVGDIHQPLHVGAIYLNAAGKPVDPDPGKFDPKTDNRGGNDVLVVPTKEKLHHHWDEIPGSMTDNKIDAAWLKRARATPQTPGAIEDWAVAWATDTMASAAAALKPPKYGKKQGKTWSATLPPDYATKMATIKKAQLTKAGARLSQVLQTIWP